MIADLVLLIVVFVIGGFVAYSISYTDLMIFFVLAAISLGVAGYLLYRWNKEDEEQIAHGDAQR